MGNTITDEFYWGQFGVGLQEKEVIDGDEQARYGMRFWWNATLLRTFKDKKCGTDFSLYWIKLTV